MDKILLKLFKKYFIFKIQEDWKNELKEVDEEELKKWMDEELLLKMDTASEGVLEKLKEELMEKWEYELYYDISNFIEDWKEHKKQAEEKADQWNTDDNLDDGKTMLICHDRDESALVCKECVHVEPHLYEESCDTLCGDSNNRKCEPYEAEIEEQDNYTEQNEAAVPDEIAETGGL